MGMDYKSAGVDVEAGRAFVDRIRSSVEATFRPEVVGGLGGFGGVMRLPAGMRKPLLVSGTDGVGTKLELAQDHGSHHNVGIDLVAMCVNDVITSGAAPLFFLDYMATGALSPEAMAEVVEGIAAGCRRSGCSLLGGETAEMPGFYPAGRYDLAGFCVAVVGARRASMRGVCRCPNRVVPSAPAIASTLRTRLNPLLCTPLLATPTILSPAPMALPSMTSSSSTTATQKPARSYRPAG